METWISIWNTSLNKHISIPFFFPGNQITADSKRQITDNSELNKSPHTNPWMTAAEMKLIIQTKENIWKCHKRNQDILDIKDNNTDQNFGLQKKCTCHTDKMQCERLPKPTMNYIHNNWKQEWNDHSTDFKLLHKKKFIDINEIYSSKTCSYLDCNIAVTVQFTWSRDSKTVVASTCYESYGDSSQWADECWFLLSILISKAQLTITITTPSIQCSI